MAEQKTLADMLRPEPSELERLVREQFEGHLPPVLAPRHVELFDHYAAFALAGLASGSYSGDGIHEGVPNGRAYPPDLAQEACSLAYEMLKARVAFVEAYMDDVRQKDGRRLELAAQFLPTMLSRGLQGWAAIEKAIAYATAMEEHIGGAETDGLHRIDGDFKDD